MASDPITQVISQVRGRGWVIMPHLTPTYDVEHVLIHTHGTVTDLVTLPDDGLSQVARLDGAFNPDRPLHVPIVRWIHHVPLDLALSWALGTATDNDLATAASAIWIDPPLFDTVWQRQLWTDPTPADTADHD